jgi:hypothetical protein
MNFVKCLAAALVCALPSVANAAQIVVQDVQVPGAYSPAPAFPETVSVDPAGGNVTSLSLTIDFVINRARIISASAQAARLLRSIFRPTSRTSKTG